MTFYVTLYVGRFISGQYILTISVVVMNTGPVHSHRFAVHLFLGGRIKEGLISKQHRFRWSELGLKFLAVVCFLFCFKSKHLHSQMKWLYVDFFFFCSAPLKAFSPPGPCRDINELERMYCLQTLLLNFSILKKFQANTWNCFQCIFIGS